MSVRRHGEQDIEALLSHRFARPALLDEALTHRSVGSAALAYERLEFLGDRVLGLIVAAMLYERFPHEPEGALTRRLVALVRKEAIADIVREIGLAAHIRLAKNEAPGARETPKLLSDVGEAVIAALYLDGGLPAARDFVRRHWEPRLADAGTPPKDAKTALQEWVQARRLPAPKYEVVATEGPPHQPRFTVAVSVDAMIGDGPFRAEATAGVKRQAEGDAAAALLARLAERA